MEKMKNLKEILVFLFSMHMGIDKAKADGEMTTADLAFLIDPMTKAVPAIQDADQVKVEIEQATDQDFIDLKTFIRENYDIADDDLEKKIEDAVALAPMVAKFFV